MAEFKSTEESTKGCMGCDRTQSPNCCYRCCWPCCGACAVHNWNSGESKLDIILAWIFTCSYWGSYLSFFYAIKSFFTKIQKLFQNIMLKAGAVAAKQGGNVNENEVMKVGMDIMNEIRTYWTSKSMLLRCFMPFLCCMSCAGCIWFCCIWNPTLINNNAAAVGAPIVIKQYEDPRAGQMPQPN